MSTIWKLGRWVILPTLVVLAYLWWQYSHPVQLEAPVGTPYVKPVPEDWATHQTANRAAIAEHLDKHKDDYFGFAQLAVSKSDGIPYIILNLLPRLAPELWGPEENFLSAMGLYRDPRLGNYPMPMGIGISGLNRDDPEKHLDYASFTCGGCHVGRVRLDNGNLQYLDGGINSQFDITGYRRLIVETLNKVYAGETDPAKRGQKVLDAILAELDKAETENPNYFYNDYRHGKHHFDADYEKQQIDLFRQDAAKYVDTFVKHQEQVYAGWKMVAKRNYADIEAETIHGFPGMEDAISFNAVHAYQGLKEKWYTAPFAGLAFPGIAAVTDIMAVWDQQTRDPARWDDGKKILIDGGGQWNGHIPMLLYKNLAAQVTLGFNDVDPTVSAHAERLLMKLPAPAYPFPVDVALAKQGQQLFADNCAICHQPNNGRIYHGIGTHKGRALVSDGIITLAAQFGFAADCGPDTEVVLSDKTVKPCAEYKGVSLKDRANQLMTNPNQHDAYNALPLVGLWAQAPYLHNGSVPTLYHMLVPGERPGAFIKSRLDYDTEKVGFSWDPNVIAPAGEGYLYEPKASPIIGHQGHGRDFILDGQTYKLDWSDNPEGVKALLEYLKTL